jgi:long-subunit acyl-CoA synthetase (AMP-forming)
MDRKKELIITWSGENISPAATRTLKLKGRVVHAKHAAVIDALSSA